MFVVLHIVDALKKLVLCIDSVNLTPTVNFNLYLKDVRFGQKSYFLKMKINKSHEPFSAQAVYFFKFFRMKINY